MTKKEFVAMSLPYGLKVLIPESDNKYCRKTVIGTVGAVYDDGSITCHDTVNACPRWYKPILYPLPNDLAGIAWAETFIIAISYIEMHYDVAGLIEKGQAVDVNSLEVNPYSGKVNPYKKK